jgi:PAS domain S-box-containing protein
MNQTHSIIRTFRYLFRRYRYTVLTGAALAVLAWSVETGVLLLLGDPHNPILELVIYLVLAISLALVTDSRRRVEVQLRQLSQAVAQSPALVQITDLHGRIEYVNPKFSEVTGYTLDEVIGQKPSLLSSGETSREEYARLWQTISAGGEWRGEFHNRKKNGALYWEQAVIGPVKDSAGRITHYVAVKEDITARKAAEAAEREQRTLAQALLDIANALSSALRFEDVLDRILSNLDRVIKHDVAIVHLIEDGVTRVVAGHDLTGRGLDTWTQTLHMTVTEVPDLCRAVETGRCQIVPDTQAEPDWKTFPEHDWIRSNVVVPLSAEGQVIGILELSSATPNFFKVQDADRLQGLAGQVSLALHNARLYQRLETYASQQAEQVAARTAELAQQTKVLQTILETMGEGVIFVERGQIQYINRALTAMLGYAAEEFPDDFRQAFQITVKDLALDRVLAESDARFKQGKLWQTDVTLRHKDGHDLAMALTAARVYDADQQPQGSVTVLRDVTEQKALQAQRELFLTHAAHELRTPLANIKSRLYLLRHQPDKINAHLDVLEQVTTNMHSLIEELLDLLRLGRQQTTLTIQLFELRPVLERITNQQTPTLEKKGGTLTCTLPNEPVIVCGDQRRLTQALTRLINHAVNYVPAQGRVVVQAEPDHSDETHCAQLRLYHEWPHMENAAPNQAFEQFLPGYQSEDASLGLGLAIAAEVIKLHRGSIRVENEPGNRSVLVVRLPMHEGCPP